jgi:hypothetical protein
MDKAVEVNGCKKCKHLPCLEHRVDVFGRPLLFFAVQGDDRETAEWNSDLDMMECVQLEVRMNTVFLPVVASTHCADARNCLASAMWLDHIHFNRKGARSEPTHTSGEILVLLPRHKQRLLSQRKRKHADEEESSLKSPKRVKRTEQVPLSPIEEEDTLATVKATLKGIAWDTLSGRYTGARRFTSAWTRMGFAIRCACHFRRVADGLGLETSHGAVLDGEE